MKKTFTLFLLLLFFSCYLGFSQDLTITVGGGSSITCPATPTATWAGSNDEISFSNWSRGSGVTCASAANGLNGSGFNTSDANASFTANKFYSVSIIVASTATFNLTEIYWNSAVSSGNATYSIKYSINGGTVEDFGTPVSGGNTGGTFSGNVAIPAGSSLVLYYIPSNTNSNARTVRWINGSTITLSGVVLPINLSSLNVNTSNKKNKLEFSTISEVNSSHFEIERATEANLFKGIGKVLASGNSSGERSYTFTDEKPVKGTNYYRLKMIDNDGTYRYSNVVSAYFGKNDTGLIITPNLVHNSLKISFEEPVENGRILIYNLDGKLVQSHLLAEGIDVLRVDVSELVSGQYVIQYQSDQGSETVRFVKE